MPRPLSLLLGLVVLGGVLAFAGWLMVRAVRKSDDPAALVFKWFLSLLFSAGLYFLIRTVGFGYGSAFVIPFACVLFGVVMSIVWAPSIGAMLARPLTALFDGGSEEPEPQPLYSIALARRKRGQVNEALAEVRKQLSRFPRDFTGQMLLAEIQAEDLRDLPAAQFTIERFCQQPGHAPQNTWSALDQLASWHLKFAQDPAAAREALEKIIELLPNTEQANVASQRLSHLADRGALIASHDRRPIHLPAGAQNVGLLRDTSALRRPEEDPAALAAEYVRHLDEYPRDAEVREKLAHLYAEHYERLDLAVDQLEQLIQQPNQAIRQVARWLNTVADLQIRCGKDLEAAKAALQRIIDLYPNLAVAEAARKRMDYLPLELKRLDTRQAVKLGSYEQNIGLKKSSGSAGTSSRPASDSR